MLYVQKTIHVFNCVVKSKPLKAQYYLLPSTNGNDVIAYHKFDGHTRDSIDLRFNLLNIKPQTLVVAGAGNLYAMKWLTRKL